MVNILPYLYNLSIIIIYALSSLLGHIPQKIGHPVKKSGGLPWKIPKMPR
jgi:hypothetical protein